jgi:serine/threonine protein kinase
MMFHFKSVAEERNEENTKMLNCLPSVHPVSKTNKSLIEPPRFKKINRLGGGTYGRVYQAQMSPTEEQPGALVAISEKEQKETVAVKRNFISPVLNETIGSIREMDILNLVKDHPYCIRMKNVSFEMPFLDGSLSPADSNWISDKVYFVLEKGHCNGDKYIRGYHGVPGGTPPLVNERKIFITQILIALEFLHSRGVYHRDIKPANIICFNDDDKNFKQAKLTDFGLSQHYSSQSMSSTGFVTLWYRAPEITLAQEYDFKIDVWSMGCILFEMFSSGNRRFLEPSNDEQLINKIIEKLPFSKESYTLAQLLYGRKITRSYNGLQKNRFSIEQQLNCTESQISQFNSSKLGGQPNFGTFKELVDLLEHMLVVNPEERWTITQCLNHSFFDGVRELIDQTRFSFGINCDGIWITSPPSTLDYSSSPIRSRGMKWFQIIYTHRSHAPIANWYSHRIFFHAMEMFDRFLLNENIEDTTEQRSNPHESKIVVWVNTFMFMSAKYFRVLTVDLGLNSFTIGTIPNEFNIFRLRAQQFEEHVVKNIFKHKIYEPTIYEEAENFLTENAIAHFIKLIIQGEITPGIRLKTFCHNQSHLIAMKNRQRSPIPAPSTPVVSLVNY